MLIGSTALVSGAAQAETPGPEESGIEVRLRDDLTLVLGHHSTSHVLELATPAPGSLLRLRPGKNSQLRIRNDTPDRAGLTLVGLRGWGAADAPTVREMAAMVQGSQQNCDIKPNDSGTALIRAVPSPGNEAGRGAVGVLVIEDAVAPEVDSDRVLLLQDWLVGADGQLRFGSVPPVDAVERVITINRRTRPEEATLPPRARVSLRLVNGSAQRVMLVACEGTTPAVVAIDGQPCAMFTPARGAVPIGPGARFDLVADLPDTPGQEVRVVLRGTERLAGIVEPDRALLVLRTDGAQRDRRPPIAPLPPNLALPSAIPLEAAKRIDLSFAALERAPLAWTVNGAAASAAPLLTVREGDAVTLGLFNDSASLVPIRVRGQALRVLHAKDDGWDPYWRDSVLLPPRSRSHVAFMADTPGRWAVESGFDDQLLAGLRCWVLVKPR